MGSHVFVSHSQRDSAVARELVTFLESYGIKCWLSSRDIRSGQNWAVALDTAIDNSKLMVFVLSSHSNQDKFQVIRELEEANNRRIPILTYRLEDITPSHGIRFFVRASQFCDAFRRSGKDVGNDLLESLELLMPGCLGAVPERGLQLGSEALPVATGSSPQEGRRLPAVGWVFLAVGACVAIILFAATLLFHLSSKKVKGEMPTGSYPEQPAISVQGETVSLEQRAAKGDAKAQVQLAMKCGNETRDYENAIFWAKKAAAQGDADGMALLAEQYRRGLGVNKDVNKAIEWYEKAAALGNRMAARNLKILKNGNSGSIIPITSGDQELQKEAASGDPDAQTKLAAKLIQAQKISEGLDWMRKAAAQNHPAAMCELGTMYCTGSLGLEKDEQKAVDLWKKASAAGSAMAKHNLDFYLRKKGSESP